METIHLICSKSKCKAVLPPEIPGQQFFKTCAKCRNADAIRRKRKRKRDEMEKKNSGPVPSPPPGLQSERQPLATIRENDPGPQEGMLSEESDKEEETGAVRLI